MKQLTKKEIKKKNKRFKRHQNIVLLLENIQYARNVASIFRTADAGGVSEIILTGISHTPPFGKDLVKASRHKEKRLPWTKAKSSGKAIEKLKKQGFKIIAVELTDDAIPIDQLKQYTEQMQKICFVLGNETYGITKKTLNRCDLAVSIPMYGKGASLNVSVAAGIVLFAI